MLEALNSIDTRLFLLINQHHTPWCDTLMFYISGTTFWIPLYVVLLSWLMYTYKKQSWIYIVAVILVVAIANEVSSEILKPLTQRLRPSHEPALAGLVHIVRGYTGGRYGFASSHAANTFGLAVFMLLVIKNRWFATALLLWAATVSYSRIYLGVHYPGDVLCGALIGTGCAILFYKLLHALLLQKNKRIPLIR